MRNAGFAEMIDFTRPGSATYVDADGVIRVAAVNVPRFDYANGRRQLLLEGPATNFIAAGANPRLWGGNGGDIADYDVPFGVLTNGVLSISRGESYHRVSRSFNQGFSEGDKLGFLAVVKEGDNSSGQVGVTVGFADEEMTRYGVVEYAFDTGEFNLRQESACSFDNLSALELASGVVLIRGTMTAKTDVISGSFGVGPRSSVPGQNVVVYAGQMEFGANPSSLIYSIDGSDTTRPADKAQLTEPVAALLRRDEVSLLVQGQGFQGEGGRLVGDGSSRRIVGFGTSETAIYAGNANAVTIGEAARPLPAFGIAVANSIPDSAKRGSFNSEAVVSNAFPLDSGFEEVFLGRDGAGRFAPGWFDKIVIWPFRMTDEDLQTKAEPYA